MSRHMFGVVGVAILMSAQVEAQPITTGFLNRSVVVDGEAHAYQVYVPR